MNLRGIGYIGLAVPDVAQWSDFATSVIGLMPIAPPAGASAPESVAYFKGDDRQWRIALHQADSPGLAYVGFEVRDDTAFRAAVAHLEAESLGPKSATDDELAARGVRAMVHVADPSGTRIEIFWGPAVDEGFLSPVGVPRFVGENGFGHFVSLVSDLDKSMDFYLRALGMRLSDFVQIAPGMSIQFLRCTPRHHTVALGHFGPIDGLHHIAIEVDDIDQVGAALDRAMRAGAPITASLGRHKNDHMLSFYMRSPAGFEVEIGCGGRLVDDATWIANQSAGGDVWGHHGLTGDAVSESVASGQA